MSDKDDDDDFTRIEDLSDFVHEDDEDAASTEEPLENTEEEFTDFGSDTDFSGDDENSFAGPDDDPNSESDPFSNDEPNSDNPLDEESFGANSDESFETTFNDENTDFLEDSNTDDSEIDSSSDFEAEQSFDETQEDDSFASDNTDSLHEDEQSALENMTEAKVNSDSLSENRDGTKDTQMDEKISSTPVGPQKEDFADVKKFGQSMALGKISLSGNPPYSILISNIKYKDDVEDIKIILREFNLLTSSNEKIMQDSLERGSLLLSQMGEYSAILIAHKLRRFDCNISMGLSEELHPNQNYPQNAQGLSTHLTIKFNKKGTLSALNQDKIQLSQITLSTLDKIEGLPIKQHLGPVVAHRRLSSSEFLDLKDDQDGVELGTQAHNLPLGLFSDGPDGPKTSQEPENSSEQRLSKIYKQLANALRPLAKNKGANAVVGIQFQVSSFTDSQQRKFFDITCTGSAIWVS